MVDTLSQLTPDPLRVAVTLIDSATAARFLNDVIDHLEAPSRLLLAP